MTIFSTFYVRCKFQIQGLEFNQKKTILIIYLTICSFVYFLPCLLSLSSILELYFEGHCVYCVAIPMCIVLRGVLYLGDVFSILCVITERRRDRSKGYDNNDVAFALCAKMPNYFQFFKLLLCSLPPKFLLSLVLVQTLTLSMIKLNN